MKQCVSKVMVSTHSISLQIRKRGKDPKVKPILLNKEDPSCVSDPNAVSTPENIISNHFEEMHPKDEFELLHSTLAAEKVSRGARSWSTKLIVDHRSPNYQNES